MSALPPSCKEARRWLQGRLGKGCLAPLTGQDSPALSAFIHLVDCWLRADEAGRRACIEAMAATLRAMQPSVRQLAYELIPALGDWCHIDQIRFAIEARS